MSLCFWREAPLVHTCFTHTINEVINGEMDIRNIKFISIQAGAKLGGHSHSYLEGRFILKGEIEYTLRLGSEVQTIELRAGDVMILKPNVVHNAETKTAVEMIDFSACGFFSSDFNNET